MAVTVITMRNTEGGVYAKDVYEKAMHIQVHSGHLTILTPANEVIGVYAPDQWRTAFRDDEAAVDAG